LGNLKNPTKQKFRPCCSLLQDRAKSQWLRAKG
jgi:hypothetical protein